jgi:hypothetical protein
MRRHVAFVALIAFGPVATASAQDEAPARATRRSTTGPWFGLTPPTGPGTPPAVIVGTRAPRPVTLPPGEPNAPELTGAAIRADLEAIVGISRASRAAKEVGSGQLWGRISGLPSGAKAIDYAAEQFRKAGVADVRVQPIAMDARASFWLPLTWELKLPGDPAFGAASADVILQSAIPVSGSEIPSGTLTAPLVYVGSGGRAVLDRIDVMGKVAVQLSIPQGHMVFERGPVMAQSRELFRRGAVAVLNLLQLPGNEMGRDFSNCGGPCFNVGGRDGLFLQNLLDSAAEKQVLDKVRAQLTLRSETRRGLTASNAVAVVPGRRSDEVVVVDAHVDAWFDGAGDNADGFAVMLALVKHFAKAEHRPERTLVFLASAGHHSPGINGPRSFLEANPDLAAKAVLVMNIEHVAQRSFSPARTVASDGYRDFVTDTGEAAMYPGVTNDAPFLHELMDQGVVRYGVNLISQRTRITSGEMGGFAALKIAKTMLIQSPPLYHTTGEVLEVISTPGLERVARFLAYFLKEVAAAPKERINP